MTKLISFLSLCASLTTSNRVESFLDILTGSGGVALLAFEDEETGARISRQLCLDALAAEAAYISFNILLVQSINHGAFVTTLQEHVSFVAEVALDVHLSLHEFEYVSAVSLNLRANRIEVHNRGFRGNHLCDG